MSKPKLKLVEPSLQDQLEGAIALAERPRAAHSKAAKAFSEEYPGDARLIDGDLAGTVLGEGQTDPLHHSSVHEPKRVRYQREREKLADLGREARDAERAIDILRARIEASVTEDERRAALAGAIDAAAKTARSVEIVRASVERAKAALATATTRLSEASTAEEAARKAKAGRVLEAIEADKTIEPDTTLRQARDAKIEASDDVSFARDALSAMETKLRNAEQAYRGSGDQILACAKAVAASAIPRLLEEAQAMQRELEARRQVLSLLADHDASGAGFGTAANEYLASPIFPFEQAGERPSDHSAAEPWLAVIDQLASDATAPLPAK
jgi:hypothetical protein